MARDKLSAWKDALEDSNPPKMLGVSAFGELHRDGHIKYLAISSASWRPLLKFSQVSFPKQFSVGVLNAFLVCPPCLGCCVRLQACVSPVSGLVSQLCPPILSPILSRLVFLLFLVLSPSLSRWSGMLCLPTRLCFSCLRSCLPAGLGCCVRLRLPGLCFSCLRSCLPSCPHPWACFLSAGLGCRDRLSSWSGILSLPRTACVSPTVWGLRWCGVIFVLAEK